MGGFKNMSRVAISLATFALLVFALGQLMLLSGCAGAAESNPTASTAETSAQQEPASQAEEATGGEEARAVESEEQEAVVENVRAASQVKASFDGREIVIELLDNPTARDLYEHLPMQLEFSDFNGVEKIAYPPETLTLEGAPAGTDPAAGDLAVYGPWGNISLFYEDFRYSAGLVILGSTVQGAEHLAEIGEGQVVTLDRVAG